jgi:gamma-glutamylputrescine oxidase
MTISYWNRLPISKNVDLKCDVVIVGGGYSGLSTAFWLTEKAPHLEIVILDRLSVGNGASGRNAGFLTKGSAAFYYHLSNKWGLKAAQDIFDFADQSVKLAYEFILKDSTDLIFEKTTSKTVITSQDYKNQWNLTGFKPEEFQFQWIPSDKLYDPLKNKFLGAYESNFEFKINPKQFIQCLKKKLEHRGVKFIEDLSAFKVHENKVMTELNAISADQIVLALNGYFPRFHSKFKDLIHPSRAQMLAIELDGYFECSSLHYDPLDRIYWRLSDGHKLLIGGKRLLDPKTEECDFEGVNPLIQEGLESYVSKLFGVSFKTIHRWSGIMGFTDTELPIISKTSNHDNVFVIGGFSGHGMGLGFHSGREMSQIILGSKKQSFFSQFTDHKIEI